MNGSSRDIVHELLGHLPLMLSPGFADFFHQIGLLSLGLSDHDLNRLFTVIFNLSCLLEYA